VKVHWLVFPTLLGEEYTQVPVLGVPVVVSALAGKLAISSLKVTEY
jgi:phosphoribosylcarboxyaminoimidazole (NCAIR) mutase